MEMDDQVTVIQLKITMCDLEGLLLQLINVKNETLDTTRMQIKITEKVDEEMDSKLLKRYVTITTMYQMMDVALTDQKLNIHMCAMEALILQKINEHFEIQQQDGILIMMLSLRFEKQDEVMGRGQVQKYVITVMMWV